MLHFQHGTFWTSIAFSTAPEIARNGPARNFLTHVVQPIENEDMQHFSRTNAIDGNVDTNLPAEIVSTLSLHRGARGRSYEPYDEPGKRRASMHCRACVTRAPAIPWRARTVPGVATVATGLFELAGKPALAERAPDGAASSRVDRGRGYGRKWQRATCGRLTLW